MKPEKDFFLEQINDPEIVGTLPVYFKKIILVHNKSKLGETLIQSNNEIKMNKYNSSKCYALGYYKPISKIIDSI